ncbi:Rv2175c family DNA-binding protein [Demequina aestuarii]|uniref:Rv2175c family DNA-binding protein n=1 Tax=Demequina aestuarii TaxID=327095 RepID=UPI0007849969|nr:Rv2175c family DNA-binding protein [Demequina aestuarii]
MTDSDRWLPIPDFADRLDITAARVRELLRERALVAERRGDSQAWHLPEGFIDEAADEGPRILPTLRGTITVLADGGFSDEEILRWLLEPSEELGTTPLAAMREGRRAPVRRAAQAQL